jgi:hypothetical protein
MTRMPCGQAFVESTLCIPALPNPPFDSAYVLRSDHILSQQCLLAPQTELSDRVGLWQWVLGAGAEGGATLLPRHPEGSQQWALHQEGYTTHSWNMPWRQVSGG